MMMVMQVVDGRLAYYELIDLGEFEVSMEVECDGVSKERDKY